MIVAAVETDTVVGDLSHNIESIRDSIRRGANAGARLIVLPELATSGYALRDRAELGDCALTAASQQLADLGTALPAEAVAVIGYAEVHEGNFFNSAAVVTSDGVHASYRKTHLWGDEADLFCSGAEVPPVLDTPAGRIGVAICYDNEFPEVPRSLALQGAEVLALPVAWPRVPRPAGEWPPETVMAMAAARASAMAVVIADKRGHERGIEWTGGTCVISPDGWVIATPDVNGLALAEVEIRPLGAKSIGHRNDLFADRRPELYGLPYSEKGSRHD